MYAIANPNPSLSPHVHSFTKPKLPPKLSAHSHPIRASTAHTVLEPQWTVDEIARAVNGRIVKRGPPGTISTDTRTIKPNQWLFAITGENFDAHDFVSADLSRRGCAGVIGNRVCDNWDKGFVEVGVGDTVESLMKMACYARKRFGGTMIGVTGSVGKTTTRSMIALALGSRRDDKVYQTHANFNNEIGVALTLIGIARDGFAVVEMGMKRKGEMAELARMVEPSVRVITNVAPSHLANFGSLEEIAEAKGEILLEAKPGDDVCVLNADDPLVMSLHVPSGVKKVLFGRREACDVRLVEAERTNGGHGVRVVLEKNGSMVEIPIRSPGLHLAMNACAAAAVATHLGVPLPQVGASLSAFSPVNMRSEIQVLKNGMRIVNDTYNASPVPMKAAIELLSNLECRGKRVAVLGDMVETGPDEVKLHEAVLKQCCDADVGLIGLVGERFLAAAENLDLVTDRKFVLSLDKENLVEEIMKRVDRDDVVLVKGGRPMEMDIFVELLVKGIDRQ